MSNRVTVVCDVCGNDFDVNGGIRQNLQVTGQDGTVNYSHPPQDICQSCYQSDIVKISEKALKEVHDVTSREEHPVETNADEESQEVVEEKAPVSE